MRVTVRLFARLRDLAGASELVKELGHGATVQHLWSDLTAQFPAFAPYERVVSSAVNADYARMQDVLHEGDEVAFLPPVSGGSA
ncbi:MAG: MoaD/ThiS family protein [Vicinamibacterales bacterium]